MRESLGAGKADQRDRKLLPYSLLFHSLLQGRQFFGRLFFQKLIETAGRQELTGGIALQNDLCAGSITVQYPDISPALGKTFRDQRQGFVSIDIVVTGIYILRQMLQQGTECIQIEAEAQLRKLRRIGGRPGLPQQQLLKIPAVLAVAGLIDFVTQGRQRFLKLTDAR